MEHAGRPYRFDSRTTPPPYVTAPSHRNHHLLRFVRPPYRRTNATWVRAPSIIPTGIHLLGHPIRPRRDRYFIGFFLFLNPMLTAVPPDAPTNTSEPGLLVAEVRPLLRARQNPPLRRFTCLYILLFFLACVSLIFAPAQTRLYRLCPSDRPGLKTVRTLSPYLRPLPC